MKPTIGTFKPTLTGYFTTMPEITADEMERVTLRMTAEMVEELEAQVDSGAYPNRSEAVRDAVREKFDLVKRTSIR